MIAARSALVFAAVGLALGGCDQSSGEAPGAVSEGEAKALEEAAEMLDEQRLPDGVIPDDQPPVEQAPEAEAGTPEMTGDTGR